ncbi:MAG: glycosyltransferase family 4 protein [Desulfobacteraceae bacterium]|nr:glycosyltransferase family 4 protein [Desulfobacteraceae bacterium]
MRIALITNFCPHYRIKTFEMMGKMLDIEFYFFSEGKEHYWDQQHGIRAGDFSYKYLPGFNIGRTRLTPTLPWLLWRGQYDAYIKCINGRFALPATFLIARIRRKPFILWTGIWMRIQTWSHRIFFPITRFIYQHSDAIVVYGEHVKSYLVSEGVPPDRIFVANHAIDNDAISIEVSTDEKRSFRERLGVPENVKVILFLGRLERQKGVDQLLQVFSGIENRDVFLIIAGTGSMKYKLESLAEQLGVRDRVRFPGHVRPEEVYRLFSIADVFVLPSITTKTFKEPWGLVVNEAFNQGVPVIASDSVGAAAGGLLVDGLNGLIFPEGDLEALRRSILSILEQPGLRDRYSENAKLVIKDWNNSRMVHGFMRAIKYTENTF